MWCSPENKSIDASAEIRTLQQLTSIGNVQSPIPKVNQMLDESINLAG
jgi:hypothetical protein